MKPFVTMKQLLPAFYRERQWQDAWQLQGLYNKWASIVGPKAARHSLPAALRGQILWIYVSHAVWAQELYYRQPELFRRIRPFMAGRKVLGIRCVAEPSWFVQAQPEEASPVPDKAEPLPSAFAAIADATSREALGRLWRICQARRARTGTPDFPSEI